MKAQKEQLKDYIVDLVKRSTSKDRPYFFIKWSGLPDFAKTYGFNIIDLVDELVAEGRLKKALIKGRLAIYLPEFQISKKVKQLQEDFERFLKQANK